MKYIIAIDSGATKSEVVLTKPPYIPLLIKGGKSEGRGVQIYPAINFNLLGFDESAKRLTAIIRKASSKPGLKNIAFICVGISGARFEKDRSLLEKKISKALKFNNIKIYPDTEIAFASIFDDKQKNCGIMIAGTGSVLYYRDSKNKIKKIGGWGRHFGDEGSGYWIAKEALRHVTMHYDVIGKYTSVLKHIRNEFGINRDNIVEHVYHKNFDISKITPLVFKSAGSRDAIAKEIIYNAAERLAHHFTAIDKSKMTIALCGSLFTQEKLLEKYLKEITKEKFPNIKFVKPAKSPVWGAVNLAVNEIARNEVIP